MSMTVATRHARPASRPGRRMAALSAALAMVLLLTGCGAKIATNLTVNEDRSGERVMTLTLSDDQETNDAITGGTAAIDASIQEHLPDALEYSGITPAAGSSTATFVLPFSDLDDYRAKATSLLTESGVSGPAEVTLLTPESPMVSGFALDESFSSVDLFGWLIEGLIIDGVIDEANRFDVFNNQEHTSVVDIMGNEFVVDGSQLLVDSAIDNGFDAVEVRVTPQDDDSYYTVVHYGRSTAPSGPVRAMEDEFLATAMPEDGAVDEFVDEKPTAYGRTVSFVATDAAEVAAKIDQALQTAGTTFTVDHQAADGLEVVRSYTATADFSQVCAIEHCMRSILIEPPNENWYVKDSSSSDEDADSAGAGFGRVVVLGRPVAIERATATLDVNLDRTATYTVALEIPAVEAGALDEALTERLTPSEGAGTMVTGSSGEMSTYTISSPIDEANASAVTQFFGSAPTLYHDAEMGSYYGIDWNIDMAYLLEGAQVNALDAKIALPFGHSFDDGSAQYNEGWVFDGRAATWSYDEAGDTRAYPYFSGGASGPTVGTFVAYAIVLVLLLALGILGWVFRDRIRRKIAESKTVSAQRRMAAAQQQGSSQGFQQQGFQQQGASSGRTSAQALGTQPGTQPGAYRPPMSGGDEHDLM